MIPESRYIPLASLSINTNNPRFEVTSNQRDAIRTMVEDQEGRLLSLAEDILKKGLNPGDPIFVTSDPSMTNIFFVLEGNRRVTTLKLLENPSLIPAGKPSLSRKFRQLSLHFSRKPIADIPCIVFEKESDADHWIELKHTGQNHGIGTVSWNAQQKARFDEKTKGTSSFALQVLNFLRKNDNVEFAVQSELRKVKISSLQRLVGDPDFRILAGLEVKNSKLVSRLHPAEIQKPLVKVVKDLLNPGFTVKDIYYKQDRLAYLGTFSKDEMPTQKSRLSGYWELASSNNSLQIPVQKQLLEEKHILERIRSRNTLIPRDSQLPIQDTMAMSLYLELKKLDIRTYKASIVASFFSLVEISVFSFFSNKRKLVNYQAQNLSAELELITNNFVQSSQLSSFEAAEIIEVVSAPDFIFRPEVYRKLRYDKAFILDTGSLKKTWDKLENLISLIWRSI